MPFNEIIKKYSSFYKSNTYIYHEGDNARYLFFIRTGKVVVTKTFGSVDRIIGILGPGELFGEMALISSSARLSNAQAVEDSEILALDEKVVIELMSVNTDFMLTVLKEMVKRIVRLSNMVSVLAVDNIELKVLSSLIKYFKLKHERESNIAINLLEMMRHVSMQLSVPVDEVAAVLEKLRNNNIIIITGNDIVVRDVENLNKYKDDLINLFT